MQKYVLYGLAALFVVGGISSYFLFHRSTSAPELPPTPPPAEENPWVEVVSAAVSVAHTSGATTTLQSGDEVQNGDILKTDSKGTAIIHFPDGSFAKLDANSSLTIAHVSYNPATGSLGVRLILTAGVVWSKVLDLVGADSSWNVETSNTVATVRGTAFGVSLLKGKTKVVGIEHTVSVTPINPVTKKVMNVHADVTENTELSMDDSHASAIALGVDSMKTTPLSTETQHDPRLISFKDREKKFEDDKKEVHDRTHSDPEFRAEFRKTEVRDLREKMLKMKNEKHDTASSTEPTTKTETRSSNDDTITSSSSHTEGDDTTTSAPATHTTEATPVSLSLSTRTALEKGVTDGDSVSFVATLTLSDGSTKDITQSASWTVDSDIGKFTAPGTFLASLSSNVAESGSGSGTVRAVYVISSDKTFKANTANFTVKAYIPSAATDIGSQ